MNETEIINCIVFYGFGILVLLFAILAIMARNVVYSLLCAVISFFGIGGLFFSLNADYNAVVQISIYGTAIPVLFLFAIMLTSRDDNKKLNLTLSARFFLAIISSIVLLMLLWYSIEFAFHFDPNLSEFFNPVKNFVGGYDSIIAIANGLFVNYSVALILFAVIILAIVVGISVLNVSREKRRG